MEYKFKFDKKNKNVIVVIKNDKIVTFITTPPIEKGCDIINFGGKICSGYTFDFDGLILITTSHDKCLFYKGDLIDSIKK